MALMTACAGNGTITLPHLAPIRNVQGMSDVHAGSAYIQSPAPSAFTLCHGHTCRRLTSLALDAGQWAGVRALFAPVSTAPGQERERIAAAVALLESLTGAMAGTSRDRGENFAGLGEAGQMDCVDESTNTTAYLYMLQQDGLLVFHHVGHRASRGVSRMLPPHFTATLAESASGARFAVDSWFEDNGRLPHIVPLDDWRRGWKPSGQRAKVATPVP